MVGVHGQAMPNMNSIACPEGVSYYKHMVCELAQWIFLIVHNEGALQQ